MFYPNFGPHDRTYLLYPKDVGIDRAWPHVVALGELCDDPGTLDTAGQIPENVQRDCGTDSGQCVDLTGVAELLLDCDSGGGLDELAEACAGIGEAP